MRIRIEDNEVCYLVFRKSGHDIYCFPFQTEEEAAEELSGLDDEAEACWMVTVKYDDKLIDIEAERYA